MASTANSVLLVRGGPQNGDTIHLSEGLTLMGRGSTSDIIVDKPGVSRQHAGLRRDTAGYWIEDMGSRNGTFVNGERVEGEGKRLRDMDRIELGDTDTDVHWVFKEMGSTVQIAVPQSKQ